MYTNTRYGPFDFSLDSCSIQMKPIKLFNEEMERDTTKALYKEIYGYVINNVVTGVGVGESKTEMIFNCPDGTGTMRFGFDTYTSEEEKILKSDNHCLRYFYKLNAFDSKEDCFDSDILPSSKKVGLSCGYFAVNVKYSDGTSETIESCNIFNKDIINSNHLDDKSRENFETFVNTNKDGNKNVISFIAELSGEQGNNIVYDSLTGKINENNSEKITLAKYLLFVYFFIYLF